MIKGNNQITHEILPVKDCAKNTIQFIIVRTIGSKSKVTTYGGRKYYDNRSTASMAIGQNP